MSRIVQRSSRTSSRLSRPFSLQRVRRYALRPVLELMEERTLLSTFVVNTTNDLDRAGGLPVGQESLRQAIEDVNADSTPDVIDFNIGGGGHQVITLASQLPTITDTVTIDGTSQPGYSGSPIVEINGGGLNAHTLELDGANSMVKGLVVNNVGRFAISIFGDGTVIIKFTPGHTPGHQSLFLKLAKTGPVLLSGDLYHYPEEMTLKVVPSFDFDKEQTAKSRAAIEDFVKKNKAQLWIQHDVANGAKLKKAPEFYD